MAIGFNGKRASALAADVAIAMGVGVNSSVELLGIAIPNGIDGGTVSLTLFFGISLISPEPHLDPDIEAVMDV